VYVAGDREGSLPVVLTDDAGKTPVATLRDGVEVSIEAWRPGPGTATRYHVRATESGTEGWLAVGNLRTSSAASAPALQPSAAQHGTGPRAAVERGEVSRPFGQRGH
jgi:hypothetical protein